MINQNTSVFFMHNFALKSSLAAKIEIVKGLKSEIRDYFGKLMNLNLNIILVT